MPDLARFRRLFLFAEAVLLLTIARVAVKVIPFRFIARSIGTLVPVAAGPDDRKPSEVDAETARRVRWAIGAAVRRAPFELLCLPRSVAAHRMLTRRRVPAVLHFGIIRTPDGLSPGHAWVDAGGVEVVGYPIDPATVELGRLA